jgi:hypothetical protein
MLECTTVPVPETAATSLLWGLGVGRAGTPHLPKDPPVSGLPPDSARESVRAARRVLGEGEGGRTRVQQPS